MIRLLPVLWALLAALLAGPAPAHETTRSYLALDRQGVEVQARLRLAFRDVEAVVGMDEDLDGRITWGEARARLPEATAYAAARLALDAGGACALGPMAAGVSAEGGVDYLDLAFAATCPDARAALSLTTTLFAEIDPDHRLFLASAEDGSGSGAVLRPGEPLVLAPAAGPGATFLAYLRAGAEHLLAGADHLAFLLVLVLPAVAAAGAWRSRLFGVVAAVTGFTLAHAVTLTAAATEALRPPTALIEVLIALSILVTALDNVRPFIPAPRAAVAAFFGAIHGFAFATALAGLQLSGGAFALALLGFNLGIEAAQVAVVLLLLPALALLGHGLWVLRLGSAAAAGLATLWLWQRLPALVG